MLLADALLVETDASNIVDPHVYWAGLSGRAGKIEKEGSEIWNVSTTPATGSHQAVAVDFDGNVFVGGFDNEVIKLDASGTVLWRNTDPIDSIYGLACDENGDVYASGDGFARKINSSGTQLWSSSDPGVAGRVAVDGSHVYVTDFDGDAWKLDRAGGTTVWQVVNVSSVSNADGIAVDNAGNVYVGCADGTLKKLDSSGSEVWSVSVPGGQAGPCSVDLSGDVVVGAVAGTFAVTKFDASGSQVWSNTNHTDNITGVCFDADGNVYSSSRDDTVLKFDREGSEIWSYNPGSTTDIRDVANLFTLTAAGLTAP